MVSAASLLRLQQTSQGKRQLAERGQRRGTVLLSLHLPGWSLGPQTLAKR